MLNDRTGRLPTLSTATDPDSIGILLWLSRTKPWVFPAALTISYVFLGVFPSIDYGTCAIVEAIMGTAETSG